MEKTRTYSGLIKFETFDERFDYLMLGGDVGRSTFGFDRFVNQQFYTSSAWRSVRHKVIIRDAGCDLGVFDHDIHRNLLIHHMNPVRINDILDREEWILDPEFLITVSHRTHNAIHFGGKSPYPKVVAERSAGDTRLW